jgi:predicted ATP-dependent protease
MTVEFPIVGIYQDPTAPIAYVSKSVGLQITKRRDTFPLAVNLWHMSGRKSRIPEDYPVLLTQALTNGLAALGHDTRGLTITIYFGAPYKHSGPSMSAMIVIAAATVIEEKSLKPGVVLTGTVELNGQIGRIGDLDDKIEGAKFSRYHTLLYPASQEPTRRIEGVKAIPVATLRDALRYMQASPYDAS